MSATTALAPSVTIHRARLVAGKIGTLKALLIVLTLASGFLVLVAGFAARGNEDLMQAGVDYQTGGMVYAFCSVVSAVVIYAVGGWFEYTLRLLCDLAERGQR